MAFGIWVLLGTVAVATAGVHYDHRPQSFFGSSTPSPSTSTQLEDRPKKEFVVYLTRDQVKTLENAGALVSPHHSFEPQIIPNGEPQVNEEQNEHRPETINPEEPTGDSQLENIFKILNQNKVETENKEYLAEPEATDSPHEVPQHFTLPAQQEQNRYITPALAENQDPGRYSYIGFLPNQESENWKPLPQLSYAYERDDERGEKHEENRYKEATEIENQEKVSSLFEPFSHHQSISANIIQNRDRLAKNELELHNKLRELQHTPTYNDQKHAIEIEEGKSNLDNNNAQAKAEAFAKASTVFIREEIVKKNRPLEIVKHVQVPVPTPVLVHVPQPFEVKVPQPYPVPLEIVHPFPVPILKTEKIEVEKPVPIEVEKHVPVAVTKNVYVKVNRPYLVRRIVPVEIKKQIPFEVPVHKPERLTIIRHIWDH